MFMKKLLLFLMMMVMVPSIMKADEIIVGKATGSKNVGPFLNSYPHSWVEMIYTAEEIGQACTIGSIAYKYVTGPKYPLNEVKIYLAETTKTAFADTIQWTPEDELTFADTTQWIPEDELTLVYSGVNVVVGGDEEWEVFELDTPFEYSGEKNLVVVVAKTANYRELFLEWACYEAENNLMFTGSDTNPSFAEYPKDKALAIYDRKPIMKLTETLKAPTNLRATIRQDVPGFKYKYEITMAWDAVEGAKGYEVYVNTADTTGFQMGYTNGTAYVAGTNKESTFEFYVIAFDDSIVSVASEPCTVTIVDDAIEEMNASFNIYPNPVNDKLVIETEEIVKEVVVYDIYGRRQELSAVSYQPSAVDVSGLNSGVYFVKVVTANGEAVQRFVKK